MERLFECVAAQPARLFLGQITGGGASWMSMDPVRRILIHPDGHDTFKTIHGRPTARNPTHTRRPSGGRGAAFSPLYRQIKELLVQSLDRGEWKPGELIPSEIDLAARFQVSQGTVRKAVDELAAEHLLRAARARAPSSPPTTKRACATASCAWPPTTRPRPGPAAPKAASWNAARAGRDRARPGAARRRDGHHDPPPALYGHNPTVVDDIWLPGASFRGLTLELLTANKAPMRPVRIRVRRQHGARRREAARRGGAGRNRPLHVSPARRCCRWTECPIPMVTAPWKSGGVCT